jgi:hypothetical protein
MCTWDVSLVLQSTSLMTVHSSKADKQTQILDSEKPGRICEKCLAAKISLQKINAVMKGQEIV